MPERRQRRRFQLTMPLRFNAVWRGSRETLDGSGEVVDISSQGVAFRTGTALARGMDVTLAISWPATLGETCMLQLRVYGEIVRADDQTAVARVRKYEFRTSGRITARAEAFQRSIVGLLGPVESAPPKFC